MDRSNDSVLRLAARARDLMAGYGRDYALGAVRGLAVRNMVSVDIPHPSQGFYPIVKVHEMALKDLEEIFYDHLACEDSLSAGDLVRALVVQRIWE